MRLPAYPGAAFAACAVSLCLLTGLHVSAQAKSMDCTADLKPTRVQLAQGDQGSPTHLQLSRNVTPGAAIELDVCSADVVVTSSKGDVLRVTLDAPKPAPNLKAVDYLQTLDTTGKQVLVHVRFPKGSRGRAVIEVPAQPSSLWLNQVSGGLSFEANKIGGERKINVVHGDVELPANDDAYRTLHISTLMGSFHDRRQNTTAHGITSKSYTGTGNGTIDVNVVSGSVNLKAWD